MLFVCGGLACEGSPPARGAWIETSCETAVPCRESCPRMGGVGRNSEDGGYRVEVGASPTLWERESRDQADGSERLGRRVGSRREAALRAESQSSIRRLEREDQSRADQALD